MAGWILVFWLFLTAGAQEAAERPDRGPVGQELTAQQLIDHDFAFSLHRLETGWVLMDQAGAQSLAPDALAGIALMDGLFLLVLSEPAPDGDLKGFNASLEALLTPGVDVIHRAQRTTWNDHEAFFVVIDGVDGEIPYRHVGYQLIRDGWFYQVLVTGHQSTAGFDERAAAALEAFAFEQGSPRGRVLQPRADVSTLQWRVQDGVYEDAVFGLRWDPGPDVRFAVGEELASLDESARVGLILSDPVLYVAVTPSVVGERGAPAVVGFLYEQFWIEHTLLEALPTTTMLVGGQVVDFVGGTIDFGVTGQLWHGVLSHGDQVVEIQFWFTVLGDPEADIARAAQVLERLALLGPDERRSLQGELASEGWTSDVGRAWSWQEGRWVDYEHDLTWSAPDTTWSVRSGPVLEPGYGPGTLLEVTDHARGLMGTVTLLHGVTRARDGLEHRLVDLFGSRPGGRVKKVRFADTKGSGVRVVEEAGGFDYLWNIAVVESADRFYAVETWALSTVGGPAADSARAFQRALGFTLPQTDGSFGLDGYTSYRLGFRQVTLPGFRCQDSTPENLAAKGVMVMCVGGPDEVGAIMAVHGVPPGADPTAHIDLVLLLLGGQALSRFERTWTEAPGTLAGLPATHIVMDPPGPPVEMTVATAGQVIYVAMAFGLGPARADHWRQGLTLLE